MTFGNIAKQMEKFVADNSPLILTAVGATGTITTAVLTGKASFKAAEIIHEEKRKRDVEGKDEPLEPKELVQLLWKLYVPAVGTATFTIAAIILANRIGTRRAAAMAAAYSMSEKAFTEYREKVVEKLGAGKEQSARDELAQDRVNQNPIGRNEVIITGSGDVLCYDTITGRYFESNIEALKKAQNDTNYQVLNDSYASLSDFYRRVGLATTPYSDEVGWNCDKLLELEFSATIAEDGRPCICVNILTAPIRGYYRLH